MINAKGAGGIYDEYVKDALGKIRNDKSIQGSNKDINFYYSIWRGCQDWLNYNVRLPDGSIKPSKQMTLNLPRYIARSWANNYANEDTTITIPNEQANERLQEILNSNNLFGRFNNFVEMFMGVGLGAITVETTYMQNENGDIMIDDDADVTLNIVSGRRVIPVTIFNGEVIECAFICFGNKTVRLIMHLLNEHKTYDIYTVEGENKAGRFVFDWNRISKIETGSKMPLFTIWHPNIADDDELDNDFGTSIFKGAEDAFKQCDLNYTAFYKELKYGQKIKCVNQELVEINEDGSRKIPFELNDEDIMILNDTSDAQSKIQEINGELRISQLISAINYHMNIATMQCGLGQNTFEFEGGSRPIQTATAVIAKSNELYRNIIKQENYATHEFKKLVKAIAYVNDVFTRKNKIGKLKDSDIQVMFDDNIMEDTATKKQNELQEVQAGVMSIAEFRSHWYDEDFETSSKFIQDNGMLINKYLLALTSGAITPTQFVNIVYGESVIDKDEIIAYITEKTKTSADSTNQFEEMTYQDETSEETNKGEEVNDEE